MASFGEPEESEGEEPETTSLRDNFVISGTGLVEDYAVGILYFAEPATSVSVVAVTLADNRVLVAVPDQAWHRLKKDRVIPPQALQKAVRVEVQSCSETDRAQPLGEPDLRVWLGLLKEEYEVLAVFGDDGEPAIGFPVDSAGRPKLPFARSLVAIAQDHFTFLSADSGAGLLQSAGEADARLAVLEKSVQEIMNRLGKLVDDKEEKSRPPALRKPRPDGEVLGRKPPVIPAHPPGLDSAAVQQALQAGVSPEAVAEMGRFLALQSGLTQPSRIQAATLDSSEEEEEGEAAGAAGSADPVGAAVVQLTKLVKDMRKEKQEKKSKSLDSLLDSYDAGLGKEPGTGGRSKAAALRQLQKMLSTNPAVIYQSLERRLQEDWDASESLPGVSSAQISAQGWLEHRSRVQGYQTSVRFAWTLAGVWDALRLGRVEEARARAALGVAMADQHACDKGSFLVASELTLEEAPPFASFSRHSPPEVWETQHTRLIDGRWVDLILNKLKDLADYHEKRNKLQPSRKNDQQPAAPTPKVAPKKKGKGKGEGKGEEKPPAASPEN